MRASLLALAFLSTACGFAPVRQFRAVTPPPPPVVVCPSEPPADWPATSTECGYTIQCVATCDHACGFVETCILASERCGLQFARYSLGECSRP